MKIPWSPKPRRHCNGRSIFNTMTVDIGPRVKGMRPRRSLRELCGGIFQPSRPGSRGIALVVENINILIVDDVPLNLLLMEKTLERPGLNLVTAQSGAEALKIVQEHDLALVLLDVQMPEMDGIEVARRIRTNGKTKHLPIILVTAASEEDRNVFEGYEAGAVDIIFKPIVPEILISKVGIFCDLHRQRRLIASQMEEIREQNAAMENEIAERKAVEEELEESVVRYRVLIEMSPEAVAVLVEEKVVFINTSVLNLLRYHAREDVLGRSLIDFVEPSFKEAVAAHLEQIERQGGQGEALEATFQCMDGQSVKVSIQAACIVYQGEVAVQISMQDITERKALEEELRNLSRLDSLTEIANRRAFDEWLEREWCRAKRGGASLSLILADIDMFKHYNDHYGHQAGDECLKAVAKALADVARRPIDLTARYGGEEFAIILPDTTVEGAVCVAENVAVSIDALQIEHAASSVADVVTISMGLASVVPEGDATIGTLIAKADKALYEAKRAGRNQVNICADPIKA